MQLLCGGLRRRPCERRAGSTLTLPVAFDSSTQLSQLLNTFRKQWAGAATSRLCMSVPVQRKVRALDPACCE